MDTSCLKSCTPVQKRSILKIAIELVKADNKIHSKEISVLDDLQESLGLAQEELDLIHYAPLSEAVSVISGMDEQTVNVVRLLQLLKSISEGEMQSREIILKGLLHILANVLQDYRHENGKGDSPLSPRQELFIRFHQAIVEHFRENREVRFYADLFCLTPKHFAAVIKQQTGINASDWISNYVMIQAKTLPRHQQQLTVQQIALKLGFFDQAVFSRFFKSNEGISPTEYRER